MTYLATLNEIGEVTSMKCHATKAVYNPYVELFSALYPLGKPYLSQSPSAIHVCDLAQSESFAKVDVIIFGRCKEWISQDRVHVCGGPQYTSPKVHHLFLTPLHEVPLDRAFIDIAS